MLPGCLSPPRGRRIDLGNEVLVSPRTLAAISFRDWTLILAAAGMLVLVDISLRLLGYSQTCRWLRRWAADPSAKAEVDRARAGIEAPSVPAQEREFADSVGLRVVRASRIVPWRVTCLRQALVAEALLTHRGIACELQMGVRRDGPEQFGAHAWVSHAGRVIVGGPDASTRHRAWGDSVSRSTDAEKDC